MAGVSGPPSHTSILIDDEGNVTDVQNPLNSATKDAAVFILVGISLLPKRTFCLQRACSGWLRV